MSELDKVLDKIAASTPKSIREAAERSLDTPSELNDGFSGRTREMMRRNREYRRLLGDLDPI